MSILRLLNIIPHWPLHAMLIAYGGAELLQFIARKDVVEMARLLFWTFTGAQYAYSAVGMTFMHMNLERNNFRKKGTSQVFGRAMIVPEPGESSGRRKIKVVVVDDHDGVRAGIKGLLNREEDIVVVAEAANGREAVDLAREMNPDVMLLDVELPLMRGEEVVRRIRKEDHPVKVLAVSSYDDRQYIRGMLDNGAQGYITKEEASELLAEAIRRIASGDSRWLSPRAARFSHTQPSQGTQTMTKREFEILQMLSADKTEPEIAQAMGMVAERLKTYLQVLMVKYGVDTSERLIGIAKKIFRKETND